MKFFKMYKTLALLLLCVSVGLGQSDSLVSLPFTIIKTSPLSAFDLDNSFTIGVEQSISRNQSVQLEVGYGNSNWNLWSSGNGLDGFGRRQDGFSDFNIYRMRTEWRRYRIKNIETLPRGGYFAVEGFIKYVGKQDFYRVGREVVNFQPSFFELKEGRRRKVVGGSHLKIGWQTFMFDDNPDKTPRFVVDFFVGLGFRVIDHRLIYDNQTDNDFVDFSSRRMFGTFVLADERASLVSGTLGIKFGYIL